MWRVEAAHMLICLVCGVWIVINRLASGALLEALCLGLFALVAMLLPLLRVMAGLVVDLFQDHRA